MTFTPSPILNGSVVPLGVQTRANVCWESADAGASAVLAEASSAKTFGTRPMIAAPPGVAAGPIISRRVIMVGLPVFPVELLVLTWEGGLRRLVPIPLGRSSNRGGPRYTRDWRRSPPPWP